MVRAKLYQIIFEHDTPEGKAFDIALLFGILLSVAVVMLESVESLRRDYGLLLRAAEWFFTVLFSVEYALRLYSSPRPWRYALSAFGIIDLLAVAPTYLSLVVPGAQSLLVIRALRLLRVFRILKLGQYVGEARILATALYASRRKIIVFLSFVITLVVVIGALMYLIEGEANGFTSIPISVYWAIVTMTTVGYGDIAPRTVAGQILASALMIIGYGVIAVPTGIVTAELTQLSRRGGIVVRRCERCHAAGHDDDARYCKYCGDELSSS